MDVTVIIPNYNGAHFMGPCLEALKRQTDKNFDILVIDNGSTDNSLELLRTKYPQVDCIGLKKNYGFSRAVNVGIQASKAPYVLLLNNDTKPTPRFVEEMKKAICRSDKIFSVSSKMLKMHDPDRIDDAGDLYNALGWAFQRGVDHPAKKYRRPYPVFSACAGAAIYRRAVFSETGLFDERHFAYLEDIDIGYRAKLLGYENWYCPRAVVYHVGSGTSGSKYNAFKVRLAARNSVYLIYKNMPFFQIILNAAPLLAGYGIKYRFFKKRGFASDYKSGLREGIKTARHCKKVPFAWRNFSSYLKIEAQLLQNTAIYFYELLYRRFFTKFL